MTEHSPVLAIVSDESERELAQPLAHILGYAYSHVVVGDGVDAARYIQQVNIDPRYILFVINDRVDTVDSELEALAAQCSAGTQVVVAGNVNDIHFYRALIEKGVREYFTLPLNIAQISECFGHKATLAEKQGRARVLSFCSAGSGDGASTIAANVAYALSSDSKCKAVILDLDYQFGIIARNLDLSSPYGIKELLDHPDRGVDMTLIERMTVSYNKQLDVIAAPNGLHFYPVFKPELMRDMLSALRQKYDYIIIDLPRFWAPWVSAAFNMSDEIYLIAQLWLKSVSHGSRQIGAWRASGIKLDKVHVCINRSGAKYKEGVNTKDFERVCGRSVEFFFPNDIRLTVEAEQQGKPLLELRKSELGNAIMGLADSVKKISALSAH